MYLIHYFYMTHCVHTTVYLKCTELVKKSFKMVDRSKRLSSIDLEEEIEVKPSTELTGDEYKRRDNTNMLVYVFSSLHNKEAQNFQKLLNEIGYHTNHQKSECINDKEKREEILKKIQTEANGKDGLILLFANAFLTPTDLPKIWSLFTAKNCPALKKKPKIFIFQVKSRAGKDSAVKRKYSLAYTNQYDTPSESDIMIVYEQISNDYPQLIWQLTNNIIDYGEREDINSLVTYNEDDEKSDDISAENINILPTKHMLISTMRKKFYFVPANQRGHHHTITKTYATIEQNLKTIKTQAEEQKTANESKSGKHSVRKRFSFRNITPNVSPKAHKNQSGDVEESKISDSDRNDDPPKNWSKRMMGKLPIIKGRGKESEAKSTKAHKDCQQPSTSKEQAGSTSKCVKEPKSRKESTAIEISSSKESVAGKKNKTTNVNPPWKY